MKTLSGNLSCSLHNGRWSQEPCDRHRVDENREALKLYAEALRTKDQRAWDAANHASPLHLHASARSFPPDSSIFRYSQYIRLLRRERSVPTNSSQRRLSATYCASIKSNHSQRLSGIPCCTLAMRSIFSNLFAARTYSSHASAKSIWRMVSSSVT